MVKNVKVIGGGLAGSEAAWQLAERGFNVTLYEMRPVRTTGAHATNRLAELVCSNSFGSKLPDRASGLLKTELDILRSLLLRCAEQAAVPAGGALAVDREVFAQLVTDTLENHKNITIIREEVVAIPDESTVIATGPLTSETFAQALGNLTGQDYLYFYDALAPIVSADSIDMEIAFRASRYGRGEDSEGDYINCPMNRDEYERFVDALLSAETTELRSLELEAQQFFEGCLPVEQIAKRGRESLAFGPMRPVGIVDPRTNRRPYAVVQLRQDNIAGSLYNLVGFQTNMKWGQQEQVLRLIPGLQNAEFVRMGQMHRNTFINSPVLLNPTMALKTRSDLFFGGQITGVEGYMGNVATGLVAAVNLARHLDGKAAWIVPKTTMLGALCHYVTHAEAKYFQPMKSNFGILPSFETAIKDKRLRYEAYVSRALSDLKQSLNELADAYIGEQSELLENIN